MSWQTPSHVVNMSEWTFHALRMIKFLQVSSKVFPDCTSPLSVTPHHYTEKQTLQNCRYETLSVCACSSTRTCSSTLHQNGAQILQPNGPKYTTLFTATPTSHQNHLGVLPLSSACILFCVYGETQSPMLLACELFRELSNYAVL